MDLWNFRLGKEQENEPIYPLVLQIRGLCTRKVNGLPRVALGSAEPGNQASLWVSPPID